MCPFVYVIVLVLNGSRFKYMWIFFTYLIAGAMDGPSLKIKFVAVYIQRRLQQQLLRSVAVSFSHGPSIAVHPLQQL
jgi:hypothetical protein